MTDLLSEISQRLQQEFEFKVHGKYLQQGKCPTCHKKSLWTYAETPWVIHCERANNCGHEAHAKDLYPDLFNSWTERYQVPEQSKPVAEQNPRAAADAYLSIGRGFELCTLAGLYTQETYFDQRADQGRGAGSATVRFTVADTWWERLIDRPWRFAKKANFKTGGTYAGHWWSMPSLSFAALPPPAPETAVADAMQRAMLAASAAGPATEAAPAAPTALPPPAELWLVEGIFDAIALGQHGIAAVALMSCNNYPGHALDALDAQLKHQGGTVKPPVLVWALDGDKAGRDFTRKHVAKARAAGWICKAAQIPQKGKAKLDWNDAHQRDQLKDEQLKTYRYHGALLIAATAQDKALIIYNHTSRAEFDLDHGNKLFWFKLDMPRYRKAMEQLEEDIEAGHKTYMTDDEKRTAALTESGTLQPIANCKPQALYYQRNDVTQEAWYYFSVAFPHDGGTIKGTFTAGQLTAASEFKKQLLHMAPGAMFSGSSYQLEKIMQRQLENPKIVQTIDFIGYSAPHKTYILGKVAVREGQIIEANAEDYFDIDKLSIKTLQKSIRLAVNPDAQAYDRSDWVQHLWTAFGAKGFVALTYWFGSLFAEQIRAEQQSFPFLEIVGEPGSGKTTLIQFLWKLFGRDYEGFDPSKSTSAGRMRTFTQISGLPIVLIESDRETKSGGQAHVKSFDWDELKDAYNGNSIRTTGVKTGGNETYDPPFRASIVISQNNPVAASQAIMERICHMTFTTADFTPASYESAKALEKIDIEQVSGFILAALKREAAIVEQIKEQTDANIKHLLAQDGIHKPRIAKNHAQLLSIATALRGLVKISDEQFSQIKTQLVTMARERQQSINADHPLVTEFWEAFQYLDGMRPLTPRGDPDLRPLLNHSRSDDTIAINLNEFVEKASLHRQQIPVLAELKKVLRTSKTRRFIDAKPVNSAIKSKNDAGHEVPQTVYCWIFEKPGRKA